ncbi:hypothetical protein KIN20_022746 [Parelaphostrongylus tenuis]|uniref:Uncharacterized protein n=1 Tax=Parelaphostrongylus tenuis TaxID=148309 RepID=A0AAD5MVX9_PARTN|nr:hypothetical protein KIN20_022746 [Parelaphostrongylus tenuis]
MSLKYDLAKELANEVKYVKWNLMSYVYLDHLPNVSTYLWLTPLVIFSHETVSTVLIIPETQHCRRDKVQSGRCAKTYRTYSTTLKSPYPGHGNELRLVMPSIGFMPDCPRPSSLIKLIIPSSTF